MVLAMASALLPISSSIIMAILVTINDPPTSITSRTVQKESIIIFVLNL